MKKLFTKLFFKLVNKKIKKMFAGFTTKVSGKQVVMMLVGVVTAVIVFFKDTFGLEIDPAVVLTGIGPAAAYIFGQLKNDLSRLKAGLYVDRRFADPKFWAALIAAILPVIAETFGIELSASIAAGIAGTIMSILGGLFWKKQKAIKLIERNQPVKSRNVRRGK